MILMAVQLWCLANNNISMVGKQDVDLGDKENEHSGKGIDDLRLTWLPLKT